MLKDRWQQVTRDRHHPGAAGDVAELQVDQPHVLARDSLQQLFPGRGVAANCHVDCHRSPLIRRRTPLGDAHKITTISVLTIRWIGNVTGNSAG
jgi:hypothetical protein